MINPDTTDWHIKEALILNAGTTNKASDVRRRPRNFPYTVAIANYLSSKGIEPPMSPPAIAPAPCPFEEAAREFLDRNRLYLDGSMDGDDYTWFTDNLTALAKRGAEIQREIATNEAAVLAKRILDNHHVLPAWLVEAAREIATEQGIPKNEADKLIAYWYRQGKEDAAVMAREDTEQGASVQEYALRHIRDADPGPTSEQTLAHDMARVARQALTPSRIAPTAQEILELAREDYARELALQGNVTALRNASAGWLDEEYEITSRVSVLTLAVKKWFGE